MSNAHDTDDHREAPSQGIFVGRLALGLLVFALIVALVGVLAGLGVFNPPA